MDSPPRAHLLHGPDRVWPQTNCYVDLWIELLHLWGFEPRAALGFTVAQDFEGDQFTFFKPPAEDLRRLFGIEVQELALYDTIEVHAAEQLSQGRVVLMEADSVYLPDTQGDAYGVQHTKTTIAVLGLDTRERWMDYIHNAGRFTLAGADYDGVLRRSPHLYGNPALLFPYAEFVRRTGIMPSGGALLDTALDRLGYHLRRRPAINPIAAYRAALPQHLERLAARPMEYFHLYAFNVLRQLGANMELLGSHLRWLNEDGLGAVAETCDTLAATAKALQFQLARAVHKRRFSDYTAALDTMEHAYDGVMGVLVRRYG